VILRFTILLVASIPLSIGFAHAKIDEDLLALHVNACWKSYAAVAPRNPILALNPPIPAHLAKQYPKLEEKLISIGDKLDEMAREGYLSTTAKSDIIERVGFTRGMYTERDVAALHTVIERIHDIGEWGKYAKQLTVDAAAYIAAKGSATERQKLFNSGEISRRAMLAVLAKRAADRGETLAKIDSVSESAFFRAVRRGPFIDRGLDFNADHGQLPHLLQMDFIAPTLTEVYGPGSREFYEKISETRDWNYLFDRDAWHFSSPTGIRVVLGKVLPLKNVEPKK
jgi:hypothetical protein